MNTQGFFLKELITFFIIVIAANILLLSKTNLLRKKANSFLEVMSSYKENEKNTTAGELALKFYKKVSTIPVLTKDEKIFFENFIESCKVKLPKIDFEIMDEKNEFSNILNKIKFKFFTFIKWLIFVEIAYSQFLVNPNKTGLSLMLILFAIAIAITNKIKKIMTAI